VPLWLISARYDFEYEDDDDEPEADVDIENKYYNGKNLKEDEPDAALEAFLAVPELEEEKGDWFVAPLVRPGGSPRTDRVQGIQKSQTGHKIGVQARPL
jgi:hypothetical protein